MKHNKVWAVVFVTGYTSEAEVELFFKEEDAMAKFNAHRDGEFVADCQRIFGLSSFDDIKKKGKEWLRSEDIYIDSDTDITWDNGEIYTRIYVEQIEIR
jgi:hypothetical protein